jgi:hypothetical protein
MFLRIIKNIKKQKYGIDNILELVYNYNAWRKLLMNSKHTTLCNFSKKWVILVSIIFLIFLIGCAGKTRSVNDEYVIIDVLFYNYQDLGYHFIEGEIHYWVNTVNMRILSKEYENIELLVIIADENVKDQFKYGGKYNIKISKYYFETGILKYYILENSSIIIFT